MEGILTAEGSEAQPIIFTSNSDTPEPGIWGDLAFSGTGSALSWCVVEYASRAVVVSGGDMTIKDSIVRLSDRGIVVSARAYGCDGQTSSASVLRCLVEENTYFGILFYGKGDENTGCTIPKTGHAGGEVKDTIVRLNGTTSIWNDGIQVLASDGYFTRGTADPVIQFNRIYQNGGAGVGLVGDGTHEATISNSLISRNSKSGISTFGSKGRTLILGNSIYGNADRGVSIQGTPVAQEGPSLLLLNNTIAGNGSASAAGIHAENLDSHTEFLNNIMAGTDGQTVINCPSFNDLDPPVFEFNNVFSPSGTGIAGNCLDLAIDPSNLDNEDPLFADAELRVRPGSPVIDRGDNSAPDLPLEDIDGQSRIVCDTVDIGAFEIRGSNSMAVLPNINDSGGPEVAVLHTDRLTCVHTLHVKDASTKALLKKTALNEGYRPVEVVSVADISGNGIEDLAVLSVHNVTRSVRVQIRDALTGAFVKNIGFSPNHSPVGMEVLEDLNGGGDPDIAVLGQKVGSNNRLIQIKDSYTGAFIRAIAFAPQYNAIDLAVVPDVSTNGFSELAVLGEHRSGDGRRRIQMKDINTGTLVAHTPYSPQYFARSLVVLENSTVEIGVLGEHRDGNNRRLVQVKEAATGGLVSNVHFSTEYTPEGLAAVPDLGGNSIVEIAVLGSEREGTSRSVEVRDSHSSALEVDASYAPNHLPGSVAVFPHVGGTSAPELGVLGEHRNQNVRTLRLRDADTGLLVKSITVP